VRDARADKHARDRHGRAIDGAGGARAVAPSHDAPTAAPAIATRAGATTMPTRVHR
jgi:hypothetical protein